MKHKVWLLFLSCMVVLTAVGISGCGSKADSGQAVASSGKMKVVATIYPVYEFAKQVGGDKIDLTMLVPAGTEPHDWEPKAGELAKIQASKVFLYHGAGFEPVDKLLSNDITGKVMVVEVSKGIPLLAASADEQEAHGHGDKGHKHEVDPHVWLDPVYAQQEVNNIAQTFAAADPDNRDYYLQNAARYNGELEKLHQEYQAALANVPQRKIITSHAAFAYLAKRYNLEQVPIMGLAADAEPTPDKMAQVVNFCRENEVKYIFFETLVSPKLAQTIAKETGAKLLVLNPADGLTQEEFKQGKNYLQIMRENLANLQTALAQ